MACLFFFFSSRRRHTRYWRDWSSDVCSSDLFRRLGRLNVSRRRGQMLEVGGETPLRLRDRRPSVPRSEERRVGKECRCRWSPYPEKKKEARIVHGSPPAD